MRAARLSLPESSPSPPPRRGHRKEAPPVPVNKPFPGLVPIFRQGPALEPGPLRDQEAVLSVNLARGCAHRCAFCYARAFPGYPGDEVVYLYADTAGQVDQELSERPVKPRAVFCCPATDPFQPVAEIQAETARVVEVLARHRVEAWLMTRGYIRPAALAVLARHRDFVRVTVSLTTLDRPLQRTLEPLAAPPRLRLRQIKHLRELGIRVQVALEPLLPGLTDTRANLAPLLRAVAEAGVKKVTAGYLVLRPQIQENLAGVLQPLGLGDALEGAYQGGPVLEAAGTAPARYLPKARRQRGYASLMALAAEFGLTVQVSALTNPDFRTPGPARTEAPQGLFPPLAEAFRAAQRVPTGV